MENSYFFYCAKSDHQKATNIAIQIFGNEGGKDTFTVEIFDRDTEEKIGYIAHVTLMKKYREALIKAAIDAGLNLAGDGSDEDKMMIINWLGTEHGVKVYPDIQGWTKKTVLDHLNTKLK